MGKKSLGEMVDVCRCRIPVTKLCLTNEGDNSEHNYEMIKPCMVHLALTPVAKTALKYSYAVQILNYIIHFF
jgi:hypothetical protein